MLVSIISHLLTNLAAWLFTKLLLYFHGREQKAQTDKDIDQKLAPVKKVYKGAFDGTPVTPDQKKDLFKNVAAFLRGDGTGL